MTVSSSLFLYLRTALAHDGMIPEATSVLPQFCPKLDCLSVLWNTSMGVELLVLKAFGLFSLVSRGASLDETEQAEGGCFL